MSLNAIATPAAREPGPLVTRWRSLTVAKVDSIVIWSELEAVHHVRHEGVVAEQRVGSTGQLQEVVEA